MGISYKYGDHTYGEIKGVGRRGNIIVGKYCSISTGAQAILTGHCTNWISTFPFNEKWGALVNSGLTINDVVIENDVWIGNGTTIISPAKISNGAIIGANSVVRGIIEPYSTTIGNPAKTIKVRFTDSQILKLLKIAWWNWDEEKIKTNLHLICSDKIDEFLDRHFIKEVNNVAV